MVSGGGGEVRVAPVPVIQDFIVLLLHIATLLHCTGQGWRLILSSQECQSLAATIRMTGLSLSGAFLLQSGVITKACCWHCDANF